MIACALIIRHSAQGHALSDFHGFNKFGFTWVPWFFMLSGYVLALAEIKKTAKQINSTSESSKGCPVLNKQDTIYDVIKYVGRRLENMYPTYLVGILAAIITVWSIKGRTYLQSPTEVFLYVFLLQSWVPSILEDGLRYLVPCWFMSCLMFYWCIFARLLQWTRSLNQWMFVALVSFVLFLFPFTYQMAILGENQEWTSAHVYGSTTSGVDIAVVVLKYHPLCYVHIFVAGMCIPRMREYVASLVHPAVQKMRPFLSLAAYAALAILFTLGGDVIPSYKLSFRLGLIACFQCLILIGLSDSQDILSKVFSFPLLMRFGKYSFAQYVFQFMVYAWFSFATGKTLVDVWYFLLLFVTSVVISSSVNAVTSRPTTKVYFYWVVAASLVAYLMLQPLLSTYESNNGSTSSEPSDEPTTFFATPNWWVDDVLTISQPSIVIGTGKF